MAHRTHAWLLVCVLTPVASSMQAIPAGPSAPTPTSHDTVSGTDSFVGGGRRNRASGDRSVVTGGYGNVASGHGATVSGGQLNKADGENSVVGGGYGNVAQPGYAATIGGGLGNVARGSFPTVGGGVTNTVSAGYGTVGGGQNNLVSAADGTVSGGNHNTAGGISFSTVGGGFYNVASGLAAVVSGGRSNAATGTSSAVAGGRQNVAAGETSFAVGRDAKAEHDGAFVWGDSVNLDKTSSAPDEFNVYAGGGTRIFSASDGSAGVLLAPGAGSWTSVSDREAKENFQDVDPADVLQRLASIPVSTWNYKAQGDSVRHMGPMAQDFYAAFGLGLGDRSIDSIDPDGVALAAIQALNGKLDRQMAEKDAEIAALREQLGDRERTAAEKEVLDHLSIVYLSDGQGGRVKTLRISKVNVQIVNGSGATNGNPSDPSSVAPTRTRTDGTGNLIVGYNEGTGAVRTGSHNIICGQGNSYRSFGGLVVARNNDISAPFASISGGSTGSASAIESSVSGGFGGVASGRGASVSGGFRGKATANWASVSGGYENTASGGASSVSGGRYNTADGGGSYPTSVSGGYRNAALGSGSWIGGGERNTALGPLVSISGGNSNFASGEVSAIVGGTLNITLGRGSAILGGHGNQTDGVGSTIAGGAFNTAGGSRSSVSGGSNRSVSGASDWRAGGLFQEE